MRAQTRSLRKTPECHGKSGNILISTVIFIFLMCLASGLAMYEGVSRYRLAKINDVRARARAVADTELENMFFRLATLIKVQHVDPSNVIINFASGDQSCDLATYPTSDREPFLATERDNWIVRRAIEYDTGFKGKSTQTGQSGTTLYYYARVEVLPKTPITGVPLSPVRVGRHFSVTKTAGLQNAIYYEGDLELSPGTDYTVAGDITVNNGNIYIGANSSGTATIKASVRYLDSRLLNRDADGNVVYRKPNTPGGALKAPVWEYGETIQAETFHTPITLTGANPAEIIQKRTDLFGDISTPEAKANAINNVNRSIIVPPPGSTDEYTASTDDPVVGANRMYNKAGLSQTLKSDGSTVYQTGIQVTVKADNSITIKTTDNSGNAVDVTSTYASMVVGAPANVTDFREGKEVSLTTIDVGKLNDLITANNLNFNGVVYVNFYKNQDSPTQPRAVRLTNAETTPVTYSPINDKDGHAIPNGFTVATNGGAYVQGNFNTASPTNIPDPNTGYTDLSGGKVNNPALIMADAVTLLSAGWKDENSALPLSSRKASANTELHAGVLTGNVSATSTSPSGGAQNLVRFLEDWTTNTEAKIVGSVGRLFESKYFTAPFPTNTLVYGAPSSRPVNYNDYLQNMHAGPFSLVPSRGNQFTW